MSVFEHDEFSDHECVCFISDQPTNLRAIIAIHNTVLGPSAGGHPFFSLPKIPNKRCVMCSASARQ